MELTLVPLKRTRRTGPVLGSSTETTKAIFFFVLQPTDALPRLGWLNDRNLHPTELGTDTAPRRGGSAFGIILSGAIPPTGTDGVTAHGS